MKQIFERRIRIPAPAAQVFAWHEAPGALQKLIPPGDPVKAIGPVAGIQDGARVVLRIGYWPFCIRWIAAHQDYMAGKQFVDVQTKGPFKSWKHTHRVIIDGPHACILEDHVEYELPFGAIGELLAGRLVRRKLSAMFDYRHKVTLRENS